MIYKDNLIKLNLPKVERKRNLTRVEINIKWTTETLTKFNTDFMLEMRKRYLIKLHKTMGDTEEGRKQATALLSIFDEWMFR